MSLDVIHINNVSIELARVFSDLRIDSTTYMHPPIFTVQEGADFKHLIPGAHSKNLFLRDKKERTFLITAREDTVINLDQFAATMQCGRLSFGSAERLQRDLGVTPGSVTPLALIHDIAKKVESILDKKLFDQEWMNCHPLRNDRSTMLKTLDLERFMRHLGYNPRSIHFGAY